MQTPNSNKIAISFSVKPGLPILLLASSVIFLLISIFILSEKLLGPVPVYQKINLTKSTAKPIPLHVVGRIKSIDIKNQKIVIGILNSTNEYSATITTETKFVNGSNDEVILPYSVLKVGDIVEFETSKVNVDEKTFTAEKLRLRNDLDTPAPKEATGGATNN